MEELWIFPLITTAMVLCLIAVFCYNCVLVDEEGLWNYLMSGRRPGNPNIRDTVTAPAVMFSHLPNVLLEQQRFEEDHGNITIA